MDVSRLLADSAAVGPSEETGTILAMPQAHPRDSPYAQVAQAMPPEPVASSLPPKHVCFEYLLAETSLQRARLPLRVNIFPHDGTDSIIATVKNFFGLYDGNGVSFEDKAGNTLIARYENFDNNMVVSVRVVDDVGSTVGTPTHSNSPRRPRLAPPFELNTSIEHPISRPSSRAAKKRSVSPQSAPGHRSHSVGITKPRPKRSRMGSIHGDDYDSDSDVGNASVTSSRRGKIDIVASAEISVENIVEGSRRKRSRFDSSELPLFVPTQVPGSVSSVSPQRKIGPSAASPFQYNQQTFAYPVPSPQSFGTTEPSFKPAPVGQNGPTQAGRHYMRNSIGGLPGILPTPDPTICSVISDEDVALQLMRLGDASNYSTHGRTSTSTVDDALSGKADASSGDETENGSDMEADGQGHYATYMSGDSEDSGEEYIHGKTSIINGQSHDLMADDDQFHKAKKPRFSNGSGGGSRPSKSTSNKPRKLKTKSNTLDHMHPTLGDHPDHVKLANGVAPNHHLSFHPHNPFTAAQPLGPDEEDLSSKPRCQRCRKSKKGCDRQRPCGRCKDAGVGIEGCISEDEGNGRKGRYGRHMGVSVKKAMADGGLVASPLQQQAPPLPPPPPMPMAMPMALVAAAGGAGGGPMAPPPAVGINGLAGKKRKR